MTLPSKYNRIMDRVEVTPEMKERLLANLANPPLSQLGRPRSRSRKWLSESRRLLYVVACLFVLAGGAFVAYDSLNRDEGSKPPVQTVNGNEELASLGELSAHLGFDVKEVTALPFVPTETLYVSIAGEMAEIKYAAGAQQLNLRMSRGSGDNSGDYEDYSQIVKIQLSGRHVTIKGDAKGFKLALWEDGGFTYSIRSDEALSEKQMSDIVNSVR